MGTPYITVETITPGPAGKLTISTKDNDRDAPTVSEVVLRPDGTAVETFVGRNGNPERATDGRSRATPTWPARNPRSTASGARSGRAKGPWLKE